MARQLQRIETNITSYALLRKKVRETLLFGQERIDQEKIKTYWQTGKLIHQHILCHGERAGYGEKVILNLSHDLEIGDRLLRRTLQLYRVFPQIVSDRTQLTWSHLRVLMLIPDEKKRLGLLAEAEKHEWSSEKLEEEIKRKGATERAKRKQETPLAQPKLGAFWTYQIRDSASIHSKRDGMLWVDLGFSVFLEAERFECRRIKAGDIVASAKDKHSTYALRADHPSLATDQLYTYKAYVERVIDGDTIKVQIDLGFDTWTRQTIRFRGIDAYEIDTKTGKRAKEFVERELANEPFVILKSTRDDKYGRYLGDIFLSDGGNQYLNQRLLDEKFAVRM